MRIAIIGAGALGGLLGFYLAQAAEVVLVDSWAEHVRAINAAGLRCERDGAVESRPVPASLDPAAAHPADIALITVKARQTAWAAQAAAAALAPGGVAFTLQNGVGNREVLAAALGEDRVGQGVTSLGATLLGPGQIRQAGAGPTTLGEQPSPRAAAQLIEALARAGLPGGVSEQIEQMVWGKLLVNVGINALTALLRVPNGALAEPGPARELLAQAVAEAMAVAVARGTPPQLADPLEHVLGVARATAANRSSMLQDVLRGAPTEIDTINGAVVREGRRLGVPTPLNAALVGLVEALEQLRAQGIG